MHAGVSPTWRSLTCPAPWQEAGHRRDPGEGEDDRRLPRRRLRRRVVHRPHPRPPEPRLGDPEGRSRGLGALGVDVDGRLRAAVRRRPGQEEQGRRELKRKLKDADELLLATDEDREGEAIAWHLLEVLKPKVPVRRMVFHEITREAIQHALEETRDDRRAARRRPGDAADPRPPLRLRGLARPVEEDHAGPLGGPRPVRRDAARRRARARADGLRRRAGYWDIRGTFDPGSFEARLVAVDGKRVAKGRDFARDGKLERRGRPARRGATRAGWRSGSRAAPSRSAPSRRSRTPAGRRRRS